MDNGDRETPQNWDSLGRERLALERERLDLEKRRESKGEPRFYKYWLPFFSTLMTAAVAFSVGYAANRISVNQLAIAQENQRSQLQLAREQQDRQWKLDAGRFVIEHATDIREGTKEQRESFARIAAVAFPKEIVDAMLIRIGNTAPDQASQRQWRQIREQLVPKLPQESATLPNATAALNFGAGATANVQPPAPTPAQAVPPNQPLGPIKSDCAGIRTVDLSRPPIELHTACTITGSGFGNERGRINFRVALVNDATKTCGDYSETMAWNNEGHGRIQRSI